MVSSVGEAPPPSSGTIRETRAPENLKFTCAVAAAQGKRPTMEDTYVIVVPFAGIRGQGLFGVFDGHGGKEAAKICRSRFAKYLLSALQENESGKITDALERSFHDVDKKLEEIWAESGGQHTSGSTAVVAFLRLEDQSGQQSFVPSDYEPLVASLPTAKEVTDAPGAAAKRDDIFVPSPDVRRVLYCANVGDARAVLSRGGKATRLTYDDKASDKKEARRIKDQGGLILEGRVDGLLIPTRAIGDPNMNQYVTSTPHTKEVELNADDELLILACDGLWDVINDQEAVDLVRDIPDAMEAAQKLLSEAQRRETQDNVTVIVLRLRDSGSQ